MKIYKHLFKTVSKEVRLNQ